MEAIALSPNRNRYAGWGVLMGVGAPLVWTLLRLVFFPDPDLSLGSQLVADLTRSHYHVALYLYMGVGTALVMGILGYYIGKATDDLRVRSEQLAQVNRGVAAQKEDFERRFTSLDTAVRNFHQISSRIQKSTQLSDVLTLCAAGLQDVLGYERVNVLLVDDQRRTVRFLVAAAGLDFDPQGITLPLDERSGAIYRCLAEKRFLLVEDASQCLPEYRLQPPNDGLPLLDAPSWILCPVVVKGDAIGVIAVDRGMAGQTLHEDDLDTVRLFIDQASTAINRINLLKAVNTLNLELDRTFGDLLLNRGNYSRNVTSLRGTVDSVRDSTSKIASSSEKVLASVEETNASVGEISEAIEQVTRSMDALSDIVYKSASALEEINATLKNVEQNTVLSHKVSSQVKAQADRSRAVTDETIASLAEIQNAVDLSYTSIKRLSENSSRIEGIVNVINDITKRTNLLALNASIIAAQAGEYGKSFGVVADEIRNLSLQTGQSTGEITSIIEEIMSESRAAASNITQTKELVQKGVNLGHETGASLRSIMESSYQAMEMTEEIKIATEEQSQSVQLVTQSIEDVSTMTAQITKASKEQANATRNIAKSIGTIKAMTQEMVSSTGRQVQDGTEIKKAVESLATLITTNFDDLEKRRAESGKVSRELEFMKESVG